MKPKIAVSLFIAGVLLLFTPALWNHFQHAKLVRLLSSGNVAPLDAYNRFAASLDFHGQLTFWAAGIAVVLVALLCLHRCRAA